MFRKFSPAFAATMAAALLAPLPSAAQAAPAEPAEWSASPELRKQIGKRADDEVRAFYAARGFAPLWLDSAGRPTGAAALLIYRLKTARFDGLDARKLGADKLASLVDRARGGKPSDAAKAEVALSEAFAEYVREMRTAPALPMAYESPALAPAVPSVAYALQSAARPGSLEDYVDAMGWMHPFYAGLRKAMEDPRYSDTQRRQIWTNLARVRAIPAIPQGKYVMVDAASARLWMFEDGQPVDSMKVVVGTADGQTPTMAGFIRYAVHNPYWLVPDDIVQNELSTYVLKYGPGWVKDRRYQVLDGWDDKAKVIDPRTVDWQAVHDGAAKVHMRQLPGGSNFMGRVKFEFPNPQGIYLHDTPDKHLMKEDERQFSHGCVRLEDAGRMHKWLLGTPLPAKAGSAEQTVALKEPVPIYITYLTVQPGLQRNGRSDLVFLDDPYARDAQVQIASN